LARVLTHTGVQYNNVKNSKYYNLVINLSINTENVSVNSALLLCILARPGIFVIVSYMRVNVEHHMKLPYIPQINLNYIRGANSAAWISRKME
jgi:preprotein translocase subunit SecB